ncbi:DnaJ C-terminal domain-containing protein [Cochleicola gelatinilyticus]|uniref:Molecular chaperone DnaJ n=1 Tax=Cochleicola gelatinilyticus TaxID=1763537 RepID=A0A167HJE6_9FLAO|nr:J domain-containing protein [Cochleicola gelatinilyticus]OAB78673.1 molecular chaperone DnaJ [Cochleicola gelatinilyticus]
MAYIDYYKILGLSKSASQSDIKKAYRKMARKYHPDVNPNDSTAEQKFKEVNEAHEVLGNVENRKKYDEYGADWKHADDIKKARQQQQEQQRQYSSQGGFTGADFGGGDFSDFFESMFGGRTSGGSRSSTTFKGQDYNAEVQLDLKEVYTTQKQTLTVNGKNIRITIPAGVENGQVIKIKGHGGAGINGGPKGDLYITFAIKNSTRFRRVKSDLYSDVSIDVVTAVLGGDITVSTFDGKVKLSVKPGTQTDSKIKLKGKGFPKYKKEGQFGDLYITYKVKVPTQLSEKEKELFEALKNIKDHEH